MQESSFKAKDGKDIFYRKWTIDNPKAIVQIAHGMAEHSARYARFAAFLNKNGYSVYANDHRGHGYTATKEEGPGYFEEKDFFEDALLDSKTLQQLITKENPTKPILLFGHSMGSFFARASLQHDPIYKGIILSGTGGDPGVLGAVGLSIAKFIGLLFGASSPSKTLDTLTFGQFNAPFKPNRTPSDWLSRDENEVDKYIDDPLSGTIFTNGFFKSLLTGIRGINTKDYYVNITKNIPILLISGSKDPVGDNGKGPQQIYESYLAAGVQSVEIILYPEARHELLNETIREQVMKDTLQWMDKVILKNK